MKSSFTICGAFSTVSIACHRDSMQHRPRYTIYATSLHGSLRPSIDIAASSVSKSVETTGYRNLFLFFFLLFSFRFVALLFPLSFFLSFFPRLELDSIVHTYTQTGLNPTRLKPPIICQSLEGKEDVRR